MKLKVFWARILYLHKLLKELELALKKKNNQSKGKGLRVTEPESILDAAIRDYGSLLAGLLAGPHRSILTGDDP